MVAPERLEQLAMILGALPEETRSRILSDLVTDEGLDPMAMKRLARKLYPLGTLFESLKPEEIRLLFKDLPRPFVVALRQDPELPGEILAGALGKAPEGEDAGKLGDARMALLTRYEDALAEGRLPPAWAGAVSLSPPCRMAEEAPRGDLKFSFQILNPICRRGDGVHVFLAFSGGAPKAVHLSVEGPDGRFWDKDEVRHTVTPDSQGLFFERLDPDVADGVHTLWVDVPGTGHMARTFLVTDGAPGVLSAAVKSVSVAKRHLEADLVFAGSGAEGDRMAWQGYCLTCGNPVGRGKLSLTKGMGHLKVGFGEREPLHRGQILLSFESPERHRTWTVVDTRETPAVGTEPWTRGKHDPAETRVIWKRPDTEEPLYLVAGSCQSAVERCLGQLAQGPAAPAWPSKHPARRASVLSRDFLFDKTLALPEPGDGVVLTRVAGDGDALELPLWMISEKERMGDLCMALGVFRQGAFTILEKKVSAPTPGFHLVATLPPYLEKGEVAEVEIHYRAPQPVTLTLSGHENTEVRVEGEGTLHGRIHSGEPLVLATDGGGFHRTLQVSPRPPQDLMRWFHAPPGSVVGGHAPVEFYPSARYLRDRIDHDYILNYPWGCSEQTAALLSCLVRRLVGATGDMAARYRERIKATVEYWLQFRESGTGYFRYMSGGASLSNTAVVFGSASPMLPLRPAAQTRVPEVYEVLDGMARVLGRDSRHLAKARSVLGMGKPGSDDLSWIREELGFRPDKGFFARQGRDLEMILNQAWLGLCRAGVDHLTVFEKEELKEQVKYHGGLLGFLEHRGLWRAPTDLVKVPTWRRLDGVREDVRSAMGLKVWGNSHPPTATTSSFLSVLDQMDTGLPWQFQDGEGRVFSPESVEKTTGPLTVLSENVFVKGAVENPVRVPPPIGLAGRVTRKTLPVGQSTRVMVKSPSASGDWVYTLVLPPMLACAGGSGLRVEPGAVHFTSGRDGGQIRLRAVRPGRGALLLRAEHMLDTMQVHEVGLGDLTVN